MSKLLHLIIVLLSVSSFAFIPHTKLVSTKTRTHPLQVSKRYPSEGSEYDVKIGPGHHLIDVDHEKLEKLDNLVEVHEIKVDAITVTALTFLSLSFFLFVIANSDVGLNGFLASLQNKFS